MRFFWFLFKWTVIFLTWGVIIAIAVIFYYSYDLPSLDSLNDGQNKQVVQVNYNDGNSIANFGDVGNIVNYYELPPHLINAVIATEDRRFFEHHGLDVFGIVRAFYVNQKAGRIVQGGSTITQQLAKMLFLNPDRNFKRKIQEAILAIQLEFSYTKEQILTLYLNRAYFGSGNYGIASATKFYFGKDVSRLNLNEAAMLAGILKAPSKLSPKNNQDLAENRANVVLDNMINAGFLDEDNIAEIDRDIVYKNDNLQRLYFADFVKEQFADFISVDSLQEKTITIKTTLDEKLQGKLENILNEFEQNNQKKLGKSQIAVVVMNKEGAVLSMSGGNNYQKSPFNRAVYAKRQSGSAFKTFLYLTAFEKGFKPDDLFEDKKIESGIWLPENYENRYYGEVTLKEAFAKSLNSVAVQLAKEINKNDIVEMAEKLGITSKIDRNDPTIVLGTTEITLYELVTAYATISNNGKPVIPYVISEIKNTKGDSIYIHNGSGFEPIVLEQSIEYIKDVMREVVKNGTGKNANVADNIYGKTGTSQNFRDAWFVGFNDEFVIGIWIGNDDNSSTNKITGGSLPAALFAEITKTF
jgi:penicillin-binding protein 1A